MMHLTQKNKRDSTKGFGMIEVVVAIAIISIAFTALFDVYGSYLGVQFANTRIVKASFLLEEGLEVVRLLRDTSWSSNIGNTTVGTTYYLYWTGSAWQATTTAQTVDTLYTRTLVFSNAYRDSNDRIVSSGGTLDPNTRGYMVTVTWPTNTSTSATTSKQISSYITNMFTN
ncbi:type II secretion system protein [Patescibacteria group bacterium]|nr:MAG: type II secretion system protein [Patescibacteria group bacterium]